MPRNDPTLMFTNAGMVPFKNVFTGQEKTAFPRAASAQKCVRAGGKHNDLDNVGYTARHHTFFEMLGNFSFGDYFKERAILLAWELLTQATSRSQGPPADHRVSRTTTRRQSSGARSPDCPTRRSFASPGSDNFWSMGDTGPCGPVLGDLLRPWRHRSQAGLPGSADADGDRFVEIWNLVFMQYEQLPGGERVALPQALDRHRHGARAHRRGAARARTTITRSICSAR